MRNKMEQGKTKPVKSSSAAAAKPAAMRLAGGTGWNRQAAKAWQSGGSKADHQRQGQTGAACSEAVGISNLGGTGYVG